jgi:hypothetical protein
MPHLDDMDAFDLGRQIKRAHADLPVVLLAHSVKGFTRRRRARTCPVSTRHSSGPVIRTCCWPSSRAWKTGSTWPTTPARPWWVLILVEDSPLYTSYFLPLIYKEVVNQTQEVLEESLNQEHRLLKMRARPKILVAENYEQAVPVSAGTVNTCSALSPTPDTPRTAGSPPMPDTPSFVKSAGDSRSAAPADQQRASQQTPGRTVPAAFLDKNSDNLLDEIHQFFLDMLGFGDFVFRRPNGS